MKSLPLFTAALLAAWPRLVQADGESEKPACLYQCDECNELPTLSTPAAPALTKQGAEIMKAGAVGFNVIDAYTGNAWRRVRDLSLNNALGGLSFERVHVTRANSITTTYGVFGQESGWLHNWQFIIRDYGTTISTDPYPGQPMIRIGLPDGRDVTFTRTGSSSTVWLPAARYPMKVTANSIYSPTSFTLEFASGLRLEFARSMYYQGYFYVATALEDAQLRRWTLTNTGSPPNRPSRITGPDGRYLDLTYTTQSSLTQSYTTLWSGNAPTTDAWQEIVLSSAASAARFMALYTSNDNLIAGNAMPVAELEFYDQNNALITVGTTFGSDGTTFLGDQLVGTDTTPAKAFDGDVNTKWHYALLREGYLGRDCGSGVSRQVKKIRYKPGPGWAGVTGMTLSFRTMTNPSATQNVISSVVASDGRTVSYAYQTITDPSSYFSWAALFTATYNYDGTQAAYSVAQTHDFTRPLLQTALDVKEVGRTQRISYAYEPNGAVGRVRSEADVLPNGLPGQIVAVVSPNAGDAAYCRDVPGSIGGVAIFRYCATATAVAGRLSSAKDWVVHSPAALDIAYEYKAVNLPGGLVQGIGPVQKIKGRLGQEMVFEHNNDGALTAQNAPAGKRREWQRGVRNRVENVKVLQEATPGSYTLLYTTVLTYDTAGRHTRTDYPDGTYEAWTYTTTAPIQAETHRDRAGTMEKWIYFTSGADAGRLSQHLAAFGTADAVTTSYTYDSLGRTISVARPGLGTTSYTYSTNPDKKRTIHPDASWEEVVMNQYGDVIERYSSEAPTAKWLTTYGSFREKLTETDPLGRTTSYDYIAGGAGGGGCNSCLLANGKPTQITHPDGTKTNRTYDNNWNLLTETRAWGTALAQTTIFAYDAGDRLTSRTDHLGRTTTYTYAADGTLATTTDPLGHLTTSTRTESGTLTTETETLKDPAGSLKRLITRTSDFLHQPLTFTLQQDGNAALLRSTSTVHGFSATYGGATTTETDNLTARVTTTEEDRRGNVRRITHPGGATTVSTYDVADRVLTYTDPTARTWTLAYGLSGTPLREYQTIQPPDLNTFTRWNRAQALGGVENEVLPSGRTTHYAYDTAGQRTQVTQAWGSGEAATTTTSYSNMGRVESVTDADGIYALYAYDALGRTTTVTDSLGRVTTTLYETDTTLSPPRERIRTKLPDNTQMANRVLDYLGRTRTDTNANTETITYTYHLNTSLVLNYVDAKNQTYAFTYDAAGQRLTRSFPAGAGHSYTWKGDGQLASETRPDGNVATLTYDSRGFPSFVDWSNPVSLVPATLDIALGFDNSGRITSAANGTAITGMPNNPVLTGVQTTVSRTYDSSGRLSAENSQVQWPGYLVETAARTVAYTYDADGRQASVTDPLNNTANYTYNQRGLFQAVNPGGYAASAAYTWSLAGRLVQRTTGAGTFTGYTYDAAGQTTSVNHTNTTAFDSASYGYDPRGRRTYLQRQGGRGDVFAYDAGNQIDTAAYDATNPAAGPTGATGSDDFNFDDMGNRTSVINSATGTTNYTVNAVNQYSDVAGLTHTHNANGALTSDGTTTCTWDSEDRLLSTTPTGTIGTRKTVAYLYDAFHRRLAKARLNAAGTGVETVVRFAYDQWNPILEIEHFSGTVLETRQLVWGPDVSRSLQGAGGVGGLIARGHTPGSGGSPVWHFYHYDANGNVTATTNATGTVDATYRYDAFGNLLAFSGSYAAANNYRFSTKPVDEECVLGGLAYYGYRYYHFALGRWGSRDPIGERGGTNFVVFVRNLSTRFIDRLGRDLWDPDASDWTIPDGSEEENEKRELTRRAYFSDEPDPGDCCKAEFERYKTAVDKLEGLQSELEELISAHKQKLDQIGQAIQAGLAAAAAAGLGLGSGNVAGGGAGLTGIAMWQRHNDTALKNEESAWKRDMAAFDKKWAAAEKEVDESRRILEQCLKDHGVEE